MVNNLMPKILKLSVAERLELVDEIYLSFDAELPDSKETEFADMLPGQKAELERRIKKYTKHPELLIPGDIAFKKMKMHMKAHK